MEIDDARAVRLAIRYKSTLKLAHETARGGAGRVAKQLHAEALTLNDVAMSLLGPDIWNKLCDEAVRPDPMV